MSINARGIANDIKRRAIFEHHRKNADVLIIQETHSTPDVETVWQNEWGGKVIFAHGTNAARGIALFCRNELYEKITVIEKDQDGRYLIIDLKESESIITIIALYAPKTRHSNLL